MLHSSLKYTTALQPATPTEPKNPELPSSPELTDDEKIDIVAREILERHRAAFEELAK